MYIEMQMVPCHQTELISDFGIWCLRCICYMVFTRMRRRGGRSLRILVQQVPAIPSIKTDELLWLRCLGGKIRVCLECGVRFFVGFG